MQSHSFKKQISGFHPQIQRTEVARYLNVKAGFNLCVHAFAPRFVTVQGLGDQSTRCDVLLADSFRRSPGTARHHSHLPRSTNHLRHRQPQRTQTAGNPHFVAIITRPNFMHFER